MFIADMPQGAKAHIEQIRKARAQTLGQRIAGKMEFCNLCLRELDFPKTLHIDHHKRFEGGATYTEGCGQTCATCNKPSN